MSNVVDGPERGADLLARIPPLRKVAVMRASRLGDFVCTLPALAALRAALPKAEIVMITLPYLRDLVARCPHVDRFIAFPGFPGIAQQFFNAHGAIAFFERAQQERFDLALQMQGSGVYANPFTLLLGARATAGFIRAEDDPRHMDASLIWPERGRETARLLALLRHIGIAPSDKRPVFPLHASDWRTADALLANLPRPLIGVHPGSHDPQRRWPLDRFAVAIRSMLRRHGGTALILGGMHEAVETLELAAAIGARVYNLAGRTALGALGAVIAQLRLLVANDSGLAHIGYALGTPTVGIYRSGGVERYGPPAHGPFVALEPDPAGSPETALVTVAQVLGAADQLLSLPPLDRREIQECEPPPDLTQSAR